MTGLLVVLIPILLLFFMFAMQRIESSLLSVPEPASSTPTESSGNDLPTETPGDSGTPPQAQAA